MRRPSDPNDFESYGLCPEHPRYTVFACATCWTGRIETGDAPNAEAREALVREARRHLGRPFQRNGRDPVHGGVDCSGLVYLAARGAGLASVPKLTRAFPREFHGDEFLAAWLEIMDEVPIPDEPVVRAAIFPGDVALVAHRGHTSHAGILTDEGTWVHATNWRRRVVEANVDGHRAMSIRHVLRFREFGEG
ncbi:MAG: NlpC/P60 family protein [Planctomycetota bacterium JB042]